MLLTPPPSPKQSGLCSPEERLGQVLAGRIQLTRVLGVGAYGTVYQACDTETSELYAVKALNKVGLDQRQRRFQDREIQLHYQASHHPNVVSMEKILDTSDCTFVILEYCPEGDLFSKIIEDGDYVGNDQKAKHVFLQILDAVQHCHNRGIYHRDLKPENILVKDDGWTMKLADFGLATQDRITSDFGCGSTFYMSPECQQSNPRPNARYLSAPNDVWSLGVVLVNLVCGRNPWKRASLDDSTFRAFMRDPNFLQSILPISDDLNCILQRVFDLDPRRRISLDALREYVVFCPTLGQGSSPSLPPTPPYSPTQKAAASPSVSYPVSLEPVPNMDPLPVQQYPCVLQAPLRSTCRATPVQARYTLHPGHVPGSSTPSFQSQATFGSSWAARYSNLVPNLPSQSCWRNVSVF